MSEFQIQPADKFEPNMRGAWVGVPMETYHASPGESNSALCLLEESPAKYRMSKLGKLKRTPTHDMEMGTIIHTVVNEGLKPRFHVQPETYGDEGKKWHNGANFCKEWTAGHSDMPIFLQQEADMIAQMADLAKRDAKVMRLLKGAYTEISACNYNDDLELPYLLRCRFDILGKDERGWYFADTKSTRNASTDAFSLEIYKRRYHAQMALYRRVLQRLTGEEPRCYLIAIEKSNVLPRINVRQLADAAMDAGDEIIDERLSLLKRCKMADRWPALPDDEGNDAIQMIELPAFARDDDDEITIS